MMENLVTQSPLTGSHNLEATLNMLGSSMFGLAIENSDSLGIEKIRQYVQEVKTRKEPAYWAENVYP
jgi:hypothetical protein